MATSDKPHLRQAAPDATQHRAHDSLDALLRAGHNVAAQQATDALEKVLRSGAAVLNTTTAVAAVAAVGTGASVLAAAPLALFNDLRAPQHAGALRPPEFEPQEVSIAGDRAGKRVHNVVCQRCAPRACVHTSRCKSRSLRQTSSSSLQSEQSVMMARFSSHFRHARSLRSITNASSSDAK